MDVPVVHIRPGQRPNAARQVVDHGTGKVNSQIAETHVPVSLVPQDIADKVALIVPVGMRKGIALARLREEWISRKILVVQLEFTIRSAPEIGKIHALAGVIRDIRIPSDKKEQIGQYGRKVEVIEHLGVSCKLIAGVVLVGLEDEHDALRSLFVHILGR